MKDNWTTEDWKRKLEQQARDSQEYRHKLYAKVDLENRMRILDVGCGTGEVTRDISKLTRGDVVGIDIDQNKLEEAKGSLASILNIELVRADVQELPFEDESFDLVLFNIVLVYVPDQQLAVNEMARVTKRGGVVLATLEPDYATRVDYPEDPCTRLMLENMKSIGADVTTGRKLKTLFSRAGLKTEIGIDTETGYILVKDEGRFLEMFEEQFWVFEKLLKGEGWSDERIEGYRRERTELIKSGQNFTFTPCFYAIGRKQG